MVIHIEPRASTQYPIKATYCFAQTLSEKAEQGTRTHYWGGMYIPEPTVKYTCLFEIKPPSSSMLVSKLYIQSGTVGLTMDTVYIPHKLTMCDGFCQEHMSILVHPLHPLGLWKPQGKAIETDSRTNLETV